MKMHSSTHFPGFILFAFLSAALSAPAMSAGTDAPAGPPPAAADRPTISERTAAFEKLPGWFPVYKDEAAGKIWLEIDKLETEFLYYPSLPDGLGTDAMGLDRASLGERKVVFFRKAGPRVLLIQPNYGFRAVTEDAGVRANVESSFVRSVIWGFDIAAEEGGRLLVDATPFLLRDALRLADMLGFQYQGLYHVDETRSAVLPAAARNFPRNTEIEVLLTLAGSSPGRALRAVAPDASALTFRVHHSFVKLPEPGFEPRAYDPRSNFFAFSFLDFASPVGEPLEKRSVARFRLKRKDPAAPRSEAVAPIVYYVDRGIPEPIRTAVLEGAAWWNQAFEAAGFVDAFQVKLLPEGADPMDIRYNMINWVSRSARGWSYGDNISDPRTGEIIKGHVSLGSLRIRQDYLIAESLAGAYEPDGDNAAKLRETALSRIRQLAAHEVGHTLGMGHNFAASANGRASVMDYPHPLVNIRSDGTLDFSEAYAVGVGAFDKAAIAFAYRDYPEGVDADAASRDGLEKALASGLVFLSDSDSGPAGAHPLTAAWDNGGNLVDELERVIRVRDIALKTFTEKRIRPGTPMATLEEVLVPAYLFHRYQTEAAAASIGGRLYFHRLRGDGQKPAAIVPPAEQRRALQAVLRTIAPEFLALDERIVDLIPPRPPDYGETRELFSGRTGVTFDPFGPVETAAGLTVDLLLHPARASRLVEYHARDGRNPGLAEIINALLEATWLEKPVLGRTTYAAEVKRIVDKTALAGLLGLAASGEASAQARGIALLEIEKLKEILAERSKSAAEEEAKAHALFGLFQIERFADDPNAFAGRRFAEPPPGAPIGD